jgi:hypothetical protein
VILSLGSADLVLHTFELLTPLIVKSLAFLFDVLDGAETEFQGSRFPLASFIAHAGESVKDAILKHVFAFFQASHDFNGIPLSRIANAAHVTPEKVHEAVAELVGEGKVTLTFVSHDGNPHIKRLPDLPIDQQLSRFKTDPPDTICVYPSPQVVQDLADLSMSESRPFTRRLALCEAQLTPVFFDLDVLDRYFRDPRYRFEFEDFHGSIGLTEEHYNSAEVAERDRVFLQTFGIGYTKERERVVVVYLRYLADLSPQHQQIWNAHVAHSPCSMNSDYARVTTCGDWAEHHSAYQAFLTEQAEINKLAAMIGKPPVFKETFEEERPAGFAPMIRPTKRNFDDFVHLLDKMVSENINRGFFAGDIPLERAIPRKDGAVEIDRPGTLRLLEEWLTSRYRDSQGKDVSKDVLAPLRTIRELRQNPAHTLGSDVYDRSLPAKQDDLLGKACRALTRLRLVLWSHPRAGERYVAPDWLDGDKIVFY